MKLRLVCDDLDQFVCCSISEIKDQEMPVVIPLVIVYFLLLSQKRSEIFKNCKEDTCF